MLHIFFGIPRRELRWLRLLLEYVRSESKKNEEISLCILSPLSQNRLPNKKGHSFTANATQERYDGKFFLVYVLDHFWDGKQCFFCFVFKAATSAGRLLVGFLSRWPSCEKCACSPRVCVSFFKAYWQTKDLKLF